MEQFDKMMQEMSNRLQIAEAALFGIEELEMFFSAIATIVDEYAIKYKISDEKVEEMYRSILDFRPTVQAMMQGGD